MTLIKREGYVHQPESLPSKRENTRLNKSGPADGRPAVFLDRDGVLVEEVGFIRDPVDLKVLPGVAQALRSLAPSFRLVVITNQSGIARGIYNEEDLLAIHQELSRRLAQEGASVEAFYYCPHYPDGSVPAYSVDCECRKPKPGMFRQASSDLGIPFSGSYMIGDTTRDVIAGLDAGAKGIILGEKRDGCPDSAIVAGSLLEAAKFILDQVQLTANAPNGGPESLIASVPNTAAPRKSS